MRVNGSPMWIHAAHSPCFTIGDEAPSLSSSLTLHQQVWKGLIVGDRALGNHNSGFWTPNVSRESAVILGLWISYKAVFFRE